MAEASTVQIGGNLHIAVPKAIRHDRQWIAAQREAGRQRRMTQALIDRARERGIYPSKSEASADAE